MLAIFAIFAKYAIFAKIATLKGTLAIFFLLDSPFSPFFLEQHYAAGGIMAFP